MLSSMEGVGDDSGGWWIISTPIFRLSMIFVHLLLHLLLHLFPHLSFEDDGDADGLIISSYTRRCVSLGIVPYHVSSLFIFLISHSNLFVETVLRFLCG